MDISQLQVSHWILLIWILYSASSENITKGFLETMMMKIQKERLKGSSDVPIFTTDSLNELGQENPTNEHEEINSFVTVPPENHIDAETQKLLSLTKKQLLALYHIAIKKGASLNLSKLPFKGSETAQHDLTEPNESGILPAEHGITPGYYYYYYPIKSFLGENSTSELMSDIIEMGIKNHMVAENGDDGNMKPVAPLFVAMASFIGVAMMFIFSILFLPKFGTLKSREIIFKRGSDEFLTFTKLVAESIEGKDCSQRIACEVGQTIRTMRLGTKTIRIIELLLPPNMARQLATIRRSAEKKEICRHITCHLKPTKSSYKKN